MKEKSTQGKNVKNKIFEILEMFKNKMKFTRAVC